MRYAHVGLAALAYALPDETWTSADLERRLQPLYRRLNLPDGRLEMMTGIRERRVWPAGTVPSTVSARAGRQALDMAGIRPADVDLLLHCSVCRDVLEPATSTMVHRLLGLAPHALNFDISNACLGLLSGLQVAAGLIESGAIRTALLVGGENARPLLETTLAFLLETPGLTRRDSKDAFASLTIGSAAAALVVRRIEPTDSSPAHRVLGSVSRARTEGNELCRGTADMGMNGSIGPLMRTDSEQLLVQGVEAAAQTWDALKDELSWATDTPALVCTHQVGRIHRERLYARLGLDLARDFSTFEFLGNCGSASLPVTAALALEQGRLQAGMTLALLGIGSGINCTMVGVAW